MFSAVAMRSMMSSALTSSLARSWLRFSERHPVDIYRARVDALLSEGANDALETHIHLMLDERLRYREVVELDDFVEDLLAEQIFLLVDRAGARVLREIFLFSSSRVVASLTSFGEVVIQVGKLLGF